MKKKAALIVAVGVLGVAAFVMLRKRQASATAGAETTQESSESPVSWVSWDSGAASFVDTVNEWTEHNFIESTWQNMTLPTLPTADANISAMLEAIAQAEGTAGRGDPYRVCYAYKHTIASFAEHPAITGEWRGERLSDAMCAGAGLGPGCVSTAAGKYQIIKPTWVGLRNKLGLTDFGPGSQDAAAVELLRESGAYTPLIQGRFADAVYKARKIWASLPGAGYGQGERSLAWLEAKFTGAGGVVTA